MTVLQLAGIYQTIANNGVRIPPRIVRSIAAPTATVPRRPRPEGDPGRQPAEPRRPCCTCSTSVSAIPGRYQQAPRPGGRRRLPGRRQDRHRAAARPRLRLLLGPILEHLRGHRPGRRPAVRRRHHGRRPGRTAEGGDVAAPLFHKIASWMLQRDRRAAVHRRRRTTIPRRPTERHALRPPGVPSRHADSVDLQAAWRPPTRRGVPCRRPTPVRAPAQRGRPRRRLAALAGAVGARLPGDAASSPASTLRLERGRAG